MDVNDKFYVNQIADHQGGVAYRLREIAAKEPRGKIKQLLERAAKSIDYFIVDVREAYELVKKEK